MLWYIPQDMIPWTEKCWTGDYTNRLCYHILHPQGVGTGGGADDADDADDDNNKKKNEIQL